MTFVDAEGVIRVAAMEIKGGGRNVGGLAKVADAEVEAAMSKGGVEGGMDGMFVFGVAFVKTAAEIGRVERLRLGIASLGQGVGDRSAS